MPYLHCDLPHIGKALLLEEEESLAAVYLLGKERYWPSKAGGRKAVLPKDRTQCPAGGPLLAPAAAAEETCPTPLLREAAAQLRAYLDGLLYAFDLPLLAVGTSFQRAVRTALQAIPYGETRSYKAVAQAIGKPQACRAVGMANNRNPLSIIVPCHRVIGADGSLVGYGSGLWLKEFLLALEARHKAKACCRRAAQK